MNESGMSNQVAVIKNDRVLYLDYLRVLATIAVVFGHTISEQLHFADIHASSWITLIAFDSFLRWIVPTFVLISGALFLAPSRNITIKKLYSKNILRIVLTYIAWSLFYATVSLVTGNSNLNGFIDNLINGHYHMWFLIMIAGLYVIVPLLRQITVNENLMKYFLVLSLIFSIIIPALFLGLRAVDQFYLEGIYDLIHRFYDNISMHFVVGYSFYFVLGYYLSITTISRKLEIVTYVLGIAGFIATVLLTVAASYNQNVLVDTFFNDLTINVMLESLAIFIFGKNHLSHLIKREKINQMVLKLSKVSFGIFLIHPFFLELLELFGFTNLYLHPFITVPCVAIVVFILSWIVSVILNRIPFVRKYLV